MNTEVMFSSKTDLWETPQEFFDELDREFHFGTDVCALPENAKCDRYYTPEQDGLSQPWKGVCWCNPPYGRGIGSGVRKGFFASVGGATVVMLLPDRTDTRWFHEYIYGKAEVRFIRRVEPGQSGLTSIIQRQCTATSGGRNTDTSGRTLITARLTLTRM